jgi:hypothetical protein
MSDDTSVRKHLYLITDHEDEARVGGVSIMDSPLSRPLKNQEGPITVLDEEESDFRQVGTQVGMGYHDFQSEAAYNDNDRCSEVLKRKLSEIDTKWVEKAGLDPDEVLPGRDEENA